MIVEPRAHASVAGEIESKTYDGVTMKTRFRNEINTARLATELRGAGFKVREGVGGTGVVAIMENGQDAQGNITVPAALRPYMGGTAVIRRAS